MTSSSGAIVVGLCQCDLMGTTRRCAQNTHQKQPYMRYYHSLGNKGATRSHLERAHNWHRANTQTNVSLSSKRFQIWRWRVYIESRERGVGPHCFATHKAKRGTRARARAAKVSVSHKLRLLVDMQDALRNWSCCRKKNTEQPAQ
jgi:hypothetical protein